MSGQACKVRFDLFKGIKKIVFPHDLDDIKSK